MDFDLSEEQVMLQETVRRFCEDEMPVTRLLQLYNNDEPLNRPFWDGMASLGLLGIVVPADLGGAELEFLDLALVAETLGFCAAPGPFLGHSLTTLALCLAATDKQKSRFLPGLTSGELIATFAVGEEGDNWLPDQWSIGIEAGRISGRKMDVLYPLDADLFMVGLSGGAIGLVEKGAPGLSVEEVDGLDRTRRIGWVRFDQTPCDIIDATSETANRIRDAGLVLLAADACGGARRSVEFTVDYVQQREQFGRTLSHFQGIKHQLADTASDVEPARALYWYAAYAFDHRPKESERMAALAKSHLADRYVEASRKMIELHGGVGYTWDFYCHIWLKRAMFDRAYFGSPSFHRERAAVLAGW